MVVWALAAWATPADTGTCGPLDVQGMVPADGAVVPPDAVFTVLGEPSVPLCAEPVLELYHDGAPVEGTLSFDGIARWMFDPSEPLLLGEAYEFWAIDPMAFYAPISVTVTVGDVPAPDPTPGEVSLTVDHRCDTGTVVFDTDVQLVSPTSGVLELTYALGDALYIQHVAVNDTAVVNAHVGLRGAGEPCVTAALLDLQGRLVWTSEQVCQPSHVCPSYGEPVSVTWTMDAVCDATPASTELHVEVDLPRAERDTAGLLLLEVTNDLGSQGVLWGAELTGANGDTTIDLRVLGIHDVCFDLVMADLRSREEVWRSGPHCSEEPLVCGDDPRPPPVDDGSGCGCGTVHGRWGVLPLLGALLARRRRTACWGQGVCPR
ncbi:MAG: hypothetical protein KC621_12165 [Myxococcales bacterium]|nr:hypothetical protein [Myxococcales bacterium]